MNDYGLGFYCTESIGLAKEWACRLPKDGFANRYATDESDLDILNLASGEWHILNWLAILLENRSFEVFNPIAKEAKEYILQTFKPDYKSRDIIIGGRADDSYFSFAKAFLNGGKPLNVLSEAMKLGKMVEQICIKSKAAFARLRYVDASVADGREYYIIMLFIRTGYYDNSIIYIIFVVQRAWPFIM